MVVARLCEVVCKQILLRGHFLVKHFLPGLLVINAGQSAVLITGQRSSADAVTSQNSYATTNTTRRAVDAETNGRLGAATRKRGALCRHARGGTAPSGGGTDLDSA